MQILSCLIYKTKNAVQDVRWFAVEKPRVPLLEADPLFEVDECGRLKPRECVLASPKEGLAPGAFAFRAAWPRKSSSSDSVRELVKVVNGVEVAREPIAIEDGATLYGPLPTDVSACWDEIRRVEAERNALALSLSHWPVKPLEQRLALRAERIRALLLVAAKLGDVTARVRLGREAYEAHDGLEAARWLADLVDCDPTARAALAVMKLEGWLPLGVTNVPEVRPLDPWPLASPSRRAYFLCKSASKTEVQALRAKSRRDTFSLAHQAAELMRNAAETGYPFAQRCLADFYDKGFGVTMDKGAQSRWLLNAAAGDDPEAAHSAQYNGGIHDMPEAFWYDLGARDEEFIAPRLFHCARTRHSLGSLLNIADALRKWGRIKESLELFQEAYQRGCKGALVDLIAEAYRAGRWEEVVEQYGPLLPSKQDCVRYRYAVACERLGKDEEAVSVFRDLIEHPEEEDCLEFAPGHKALYMLAYARRAKGYLYWMTEKGRAHEDIQEKDLSKEGLLVYGRLIEDENPAKAAKCYRKSQEEEARVRLGRLYFFGRGEQQDLEEASSLLSQRVDDPEYWLDTENLLLAMLLYVDGYPLADGDIFGLDRDEHFARIICEEYAGPMSPIRAFCEACLHWLRALNRGKEAREKARAALRAAAHTTLEEILARGSVR